MRRRQVLATVGTSLPFAGCLSTVTGEDTPDSASESGIRLTVPAVAPGETVSIAFTAQSVTHLRVSDAPDIEATVEYGDATFSPSPSTVWTGKPPTWQWSPSESITGKLPLTVSETATPGDYRYTVTARREGEETRESVTVTVRE